MKPIKASNKKLAPFFSAALTFFPFRLLLPALDGDLLLHLRVALSRGANGAAARSVFLLLQSCAEDPPSLEERGREQAPSGAPGAPGRVGTRRRPGIGVVASDDDGGGGGGGDTLDRHRDGHARRRVRPLALHPWPGDLAWGPAPDARLRAGLLRVREEDPDPAAVRRLCRDWPRRRALCHLEFFFFFFFLWPSTAAAAVPEGQVPGLRRLLPLGVGLEVLQRRRAPGQRRAAPAASAAAADLGLLSGPERRGGPARGRRAAGGEGEGRRRRGRGRRRVSWLRWDGVSGGIEVYHTLL